MKTIRVRPRWAVAPTALLLVAAAQAQGIVRIDGSSTVFPITEAVAEEFQSETRGAFKVVVGVSGTGGGFKKFYRGDIDICDASRPIMASEMRECQKAGIEYIELPIAFDALTVMVNPANTFVDRLTIAELKKIWEPEAQGKVTHWSQVRDGWPHEPLKLYGAGSDSGTFDYFTEAAVGKAKASRGDYTASEDDNTLVQGIAGDKNALGYFGYAYYAANRGKLRAVPIVNPKGEAVQPAPETVMNGQYAPLSRPVFLYVNRKALDRPEVQKFVEFYLAHGAALAREVKYIPLPADAYKKGQERLAARRLGTAFGGHPETGLHVDELFNRPLATAPR